MKERATALLDIEEKRLNELQWESNSRLSILKEEEKSASRFGGLYNAASSSLNKAKKAVKENAEEVERSKERIRAYTDVLNPAIKSIGAETDATNENTAAKEKKLKVEKQLEEVETNSAASFKRQISFLEHQMSVTNKASASYGFLEFQVRLLKTAYEALYGAAEKVNEVIDPKFGTADYYENLISVLKKQQSEVATTSNEWQHYNRMIEAVEIDLKNLTGTTEEATKANKEFLDSFRQGFIDDFISNSGFDKLFYLIENFDQLKESGIDTALAISEAFQQAFNVIANSNAASFDAQRDRIMQQAEFATEMAGGSATAIEEIERQKEERLKTIQRREAQAKKKIAMFNIVTDTAQAILATYAKVGFPVGIPLSIAMGVIGAAQLALVSSQELPAFYKGTDNAPEGLALTQERGAEVITDKKGNVKTLGNNKGAQLTYLSKGDKVYKSHEDYINRELSKNGIADMGGYLNIPQQVTQNNNFDSQVIKDEFSKLAKVISNKENIKISMDKGGLRTFVGNNEVLNNYFTLKGRQV